MSYRYLGNKSRISDWIVQNISSRLAEGSSIVDPMCGTGAMSEALATKGYSVTAGDILSFPVLHAKARLLPLTDSHFEGVGGSYEHAIRALNDVEPIKGFFWEEYSADGSPRNGSKPRKYFTGENAAKIDGIRKQLLTWKEHERNMAAVDRLTHDLLLAVNKVANISGTYGYYCAKFGKNSLSPLNLNASRTNSFGTKMNVVQGDVLTVSKANPADAYYLDPPYTKRQYGGNYHILETIALHDFPEPAGEGGLRDWKPTASDFCYKRKAKLAFENVIKNIDAKYVFVSYSDDGQVSKEELIELLSSMGEVALHERSLERYSSNPNGIKKSHVTEYLFELKKREFNIA
ncbi:restriction endonuclease subunit M [Alteromonas sp. KUL42]|uniref:DNA adenine methylase n=1 Tax=Alteromonas sp. KUL42 TaxID=2480797 RepID=UPI001036536B|nr:DNA adenine methylase [Alteromonas sp. KUL42]TAP34761.1 DNA methyltransferase [Alteromonas sp. KUL42]GEA07505.1 restriction endonuclease subunit M [Alteromonas sp. KUL42]